MQYCSLQHLTLLSPPGPSTTEHSFCFGSASSFFLEFFSILPYWHMGYPQTWGRGGDYLQVSLSLFLFFVYLFIVFMVFSAISTMAHLFSLALHNVGHSFIQLHKALIHVIILVSFLWCDFHSGGCGIIVFDSSVCPLVNEDKRSFEKLVKYLFGWLLRKICNNRLSIA